MSMAIFEQGLQLPVRCVGQGLGKCPDLTLTSSIASGKALNDSEPQLSLLGQGY